MTTEPDQSRLEALEKRLRAARGAHEASTAEGMANPKGDDLSEANLAWRMVIELVAGLLIGFGIGYGLDTLFGTMPVFLVLFIFAGLAAGVRTMLRSAKEVEMRRAARAAEKGED
jgi:ATP synthase protein I